MLAAAAVRRPPSAVRRPPPSAVRRPPSAVRRPPRSAVRRPPPPSASATAADYISQTPPSPPRLSYTQRPIVRSSGCYW